MLKVEQLIVASRKSEILKGISIEVKKGEILGLTGHSGSGKTTFIKTIMGILARGLEVKKGQIYLDDCSLFEMSNRDRRKICGTTIGFMPQNPMTAFDRRMKIGGQMRETLQVKLKINDSNIKKLIEQVFYKVNLTEVERILDSYPYQLSGGMLQRVAIALILALNPKYILADEPTSALDDKNRKIILKILKEQSSKAGILFISHDVDALKEMCEKVYIIEKGIITESGTMESILYNPKMPWTKEFAKANKMQDRSEWKWKAL